MDTPISEIEKSALQELAKVETQAGLEQFRISYLGKKGIVTALMDRLKSLPVEEKKGSRQMKKQSQEVSPKIILTTPISSSKIVATKANRKNEYSLRDGKIWNCLNES